MTTAGKGAFAITFELKKNAKPMKGIKKKSQMANPRYFNSAQNFIDIPMECFISVIISSLRHLIQILLRSPTFHPSKFRLLLCHTSITPAITQHRSNTH